MGSGLDPLSVGILGLGHIGSAVLQAIQSGSLSGLGLAGAFGRTVPGGLQDLRERDLLFDSLDDFLDRPFTVLVECASHDAVRSGVPKALTRGHDVLILSSGALADPHLLALVRDLARTHGRKVYLPAGALGSLEILAVLREQGIRRVSLTTSKPPGTIPGQEATAGPAEIFRGSAREAARRYPRNLNIAATLGLLGIGLDETEVRLLVDPARRLTCHEIEVDAVRGRYRVSFEVESATNDPTKTAVTEDSIVALLHALAGSVSARLAVSCRLA